jgi:hypothetical protein
MKLENVEIRWTSLLLGMAELGRPGAAPMGDGMK